MDKLLLLVHGITNSTEDATKPWVKADNDLKAMMVDMQKYVN